jgi:hypothetical protein
MDRGTGRIGAWIGRAGWLLAAALGILATFASGASAVTFGVPLGTAPFNVAPNNPYDCSAIYSPVAGTALPVYGPLGPPSLATSCIWGDVPSPTVAAAFPGRHISLAPPGTGRVTKVRVGVGATTGPMQVVVMRTLYRNTRTPGRPEDACCFPVARSRVFIPAANRITAIRVSLPVREDATPPAGNTTTIADFDTLGLAVLRPGVPVPMYYFPAYASTLADFVWNTSRPSTVTPGFYSDTGGFFVAMNATWARPRRRR